MPQHEVGFHEISFLRLAAIQLRQIASTEPAQISARLCRIARDWDARADQLEAAAGNQVNVLAA